MRTALAVAVLVAGLSAFAGSARADVDVEVPATFKAKGTLGSGPSNFRFRATAGSVLALKFATGKDAAPGVAVLLFDPLETLVDPAPVKATPTGVQWKNVALPSSGLYTLQVHGETAADYSLAVTTKFPTSFTGILNLGVGDEDGFDFAAPTASILSIRAAPVPGSMCTPVIQNVTVGVTIVPVVETVKGTVHTAKTGPLPEGGSGYASIFNATGTAGDAAVSLKVKLPKNKPGKVDVRRTVLGHPEGGETLIGRMIDAAGGIVEVGYDGSDLYGAAVSLPPGALESATLVSIASTVAPPIVDDGDQAAGPAVRLEPSGTVFPVPVDVTLPFDFTKIPANASPDDIRVLIVEDNGTSTVVVPSSVGANTITLPTNGFSVCIPIIVSGPPNFGYTSGGTLKPGGDEYWMLQIDGSIATASGNDSRNRKVSTAVGQVSIHGDGTFDYLFNEHGFTWSNQDSPPMTSPPIQAGLAEYGSSQSGTLDWAYDLTGTKIVLSGSGEQAPVFRVSRDGRYLAGLHENLTDPYGETVYGVRKYLKTLTLGSLSDTYTVCLIDLEGNTEGTNGSARIRASRAYGTFSFDGTGGCVISFVQRRTSFDESTGTTTNGAESVLVKNATYAVFPDGTALVTVPASGEDSETTLRFFPGDGLDVMFGSHDLPIGEASIAMVLVRQGTGVSRSVLNGRYQGAVFGLEANSYSVGSPSVNVGDFQLKIDALVGTFDGGATANFSQDRHKVYRDTDSADGTGSSNSPKDFVAGVAVTSQGKTTLTTDGKILGQVTPDGQACILISDTGFANSDYSIAFIFRSPPVQVP